MSERFTRSHRFAEIFPLHDTGKPFDDLVSDIRENGLLEPIIKFGEFVLDGRRRERACRRAGVEPRYTQFEGTEDQAFVFVMSKNLFRRHLGEGERVLCAGRAVTARQGGIGGAINGEAVVTALDAAEAFQVSEAQVLRATRIVHQGVPELQEAVEQDIISVSDAAEVCTELPDNQRKAVESVINGHAKSATAALGRRSSQGKEIFKDEDIEKLIGQLTRAFDTRAQKLGHGRDMAQLCHEKMDLVLSSWRQWQASEARLQARGAGG